MSGRACSWQVVLENTASTVEASPLPADPASERFLTFRAAKARLLRFLADNREDWSLALAEARRLTRAGCCS